MSDQQIGGSGPGHEAWEELVAGYVLSALEPEETERFETHLAGCDRCREQLVEEQRVASELAYLAEPVEPPAELWRRIRGELGDQPPPAVDEPAVTAPVVELPEQRRTAHWWQHPRVLATAAALVAVLVGVGVWQSTAQLGGNGTTSVQALITGCEHDSGCQVVDLDQERNRRAALLVRDGHAQLISTGLANLPADSSYVLWQLPSNGAPRGVAAFRVSNDDQPAVSTALPLPIDQTAAFAVSREHGHTIPSKPSQIVAVGAAA